jgi:LSD1 subclass zinc finger protein
MNVVIVCQTCRKPLKIPAEGLGQKVRCPACKTVFVGKRDEFKPRQETHSTTVPPPVNDAMLSEEDATPEDVVAATSADYVEEDIATPRRRPKKKSKLWLILLLLLGPLLLSVLICAGVLLWLSP